ncbi:MAG TPA: branched-chain amino acid ABC transporter permease [Hyphomicrobiaceae bacterium]|nr:branched-chain amino acid ABC transporter permease [Hyphomicrobiaceae bacterium]
MEFWTTIFLSASIAAIAAIGLFLQIRSGQLNVGMAVFVGVGGYVSGALGVHLGLPPALAIPVAVAAGFLFGAVFSAVTLRLHHWFFAVTTLTLSVAAVSGVGRIGIIGGALGLTGIPFLTHPVPILAALVATFAVAWGIDRSTVGLAIRATGDDEVLAQIFGVRVKLLRVLVFGIGSAMAALSGALHAHRFGVYQPSDLGFHTSLLLFVYVIVGGKTSVWGPLVGTFFLHLMPEVVKISPEAELIVFGFLMLLVAVALPEGVAGAVRTSVRWLANGSAAGVLGAAKPPGQSAP